MESLTRDHFFNGKIVLNQPASGYRFSIDAVILSHLACPAPGETVLDLGTGCGVIPVMLAFRHPEIRVIGVEIQPSLSRLARRNVADNCLSDRVQIVDKDIGKLLLADIGGPVDWVVTNPPYRKRGSGRINTDSQRAVARHEIKTDLDTVLRTARRMLRKSGRFSIIYPSVRSIDLLTAMRSTGIEPKYLTMIHAKPAFPARLVLVTGIKGGRPGLDVGPPLCLYHEDGTYTRALESMFSGLTD
ncbi:tRNA1(Val) (adenine(37)-N6)-methyltransferase [Desulfosarcina sp.]|uniref:tRNA1(Val) (adenine(37)-N6)-methyltransferase n=1 Tax=Desulfosarcina sp. TaxID=2027861 RepID=UPI0029B1A2CA|nr:methyltransferase [Desulfosarcina sp.]MDX2455740.1 methyltransferase [Desulfosarcina sp.]MDX2493212.1 methyltransferase [Desulfosarcina sp.]